MVIGGRCKDFLFCSYKKIVKPLENQVLSAIFVQAVKSFSRAVHINPSNAELREDDLMWAVELVHRKASLDTAAASSSNATELDADVDCVEDDNQLTAQHRNSCSLLVEPAAVELDKLTPNHVIMRD